MSHPATASSGSWFYREGPETRGPVEAAHLIRLIQSGAVPRDTPVAQAGWAQWSPAASIFPEIGQPAAQPQPQPAPSPQRGFAPAGQWSAPTPQPQPAPQPGPQPQYASPQQPPHAPYSAAPPPQTAALPVRAVMGPDAGVVLPVGPEGATLGRGQGCNAPDPYVAERHVTFWLRNDVLYFRTAPGCYLYVNGMAVNEGNLVRGQQFRLGGTVWTVGDEPASLGDFIGSLGDRLSRYAGTEKLEGFSLQEMFSEVFKKRPAAELDDYLIVGTYRTTPSIDQVDTKWPKPWLFGRTLLFVVLLYLGFAISFNQFANPNLLPGLIMTGALAVPLATTILFFELNTPRNIPFYRVVMMLGLGGVVSLFVSLVGFRFSSLDWLGASQAGIVEEIGKLATVLIIARDTRHKYILNGLLYGAAVGAGFAAFESAGYAFRILLQHGTEAMTSNILLRAALTPLGHIAWTALAAGALWRVKGDRPLHPSMLLHPRFLKAFSISVLLHMTWNSPLPSPFFLLHILLGVIGWFVVFGIVQQGLRQVKAEQAMTTQARLAVMPRAS